MTVRVQNQTTINGAQKRNQQQKKDLDHLIGRPLVPFFTSQGTENTDMQLVDTESFTFDEPLAVREFKDGYYQKAKIVAGPNQSRGTQKPSPQKPSPQKARKQSRMENRSRKSDVSETPKAQPLVVKKWAGGDYSNAPAPQNVPLPSFLGRAHAGSQSVPCSPIKDDHHPATSRVRSRLSFDSRTPPFTSTTPTAPLVLSSTPSTSTTPTSPLVLSNPAMNDPGAFLLALAKGEIPANSKHTRPTPTPTHSHNTPTATSAPTPSPTSNPIKLLESLLAAYPARPVVPVVVSSSTVNTPVLLFRRNDGGVTSIAVTCR